MVKQTLDKDLNRIGQLEGQTLQAGRSYRAISLAVLFLLIVWGFSELVIGTSEHRTLIIIAAIIGGYMALNIGANDVANNVGPAVGSRALTMFGALIIAAVLKLPALFWLAEMSSRQSRRGSLILIWSATARLSSGQ